MKFSTVLCILLLILGFLYFLLQADEKPPVPTPATPPVPTPAIPLLQTPATPPDSSILDDYLDEEKSKQWLQDNGYQLLKDTNGTLVLQKQHQIPGVNFAWKKNWGGVIIGLPLLEEGATLLFNKGEIRIKIKED